MLTIETIQAAQSNDLEAVQLVIKDMAGRIDRLADSAARRMPHSTADYADDFRQQANITLWESLGRYEGSTVDGFYAFMHRTLELSLVDSMRAARNSGVDADAMKAFRKALGQCGDDPYAAEKLTRTMKYNGSVLGADRAEAARVAYQGSMSLDAPPPGSTEPGTLGEQTPDRPKLPGEETNPVGLGSLRLAADTLEAHLTVPRDDDERAELLGALQMVRSGATSERVADILSEHVTLPRDRRSRSAVRTAFGLVSAGIREHSPTEREAYSYEGVRDRSYQAHVHKINAVHTVLDDMGEGQRVVLENTFGIRGARRFGQGDAGDDTGMAQHLAAEFPQFGEPRGVARIREARKNGLKSFARRYIKIIASTPQHAEAMTDAMRMRLSRAGRK